MSEATAVFCNGKDKRHWIVIEQGRDPSAPLVIYSGYPAPTQATASMTVYGSGGIFAQAAYRRSNRPLQNSVSVTDAAMELGRFPREGSAW
jgi:hypothetical protein